MADAKREVPIVRVNTPSITKLKKGFFVPDLPFHTYTSYTRKDPTMDMRLTPLPNHVRCRPLTFPPKPIAPPSESRVPFDKMPPPRVAKPLDFSLLAMHLTPTHKSVITDSLEHKGKVVCESGTRSISLAKTVSRKKAKTDKGSKPKTVQGSTGRQQLACEEERRKKATGDMTEEPFEEHLSKTGKPFPNIQNVAQEENRQEKEPLSEQAVYEYLRHNPSVLEDYLEQHVDAGRLRSVILKKKVSYGPMSDPADCCRYADADFRSAVERCFRESQKEPFLNIILEMVSLVALVLRADKASLYAPRVDKGVEGLDLVLPDGTRKYHCPLKVGHTVVGECGLSLKPILLSNLHEVVRFSEGAGPGCDLHIVSVLATPLVYPSTGRLLAVLEVVRNLHLPPLEERDLQLTNAMLAWTVSNMSIAETNKKHEAHIDADEKLLFITKTIFANLTQLEMVKQDIMQAAKHFLDGQRVAFFDVDDDEGQLIQQYFDEGALDGDSGRFKFSKNESKRFSSKEGIVGKALELDDLVHCPNLKLHLHYSRIIDMEPGMTAHNVVAIPIRYSGSHHKRAAVTVTNTSKDEEWMSDNLPLLRLFTDFCSKALYFSHLYTDFKQQQDLFKVSMEVLHYHIVTSNDEVVKLRALPMLTEAEMPKDFNTYGFFVWQDSGLALPRYVIYMMDRLFDLHSSNFDIDKVCRFVLTIRKNYRALLYHNWMHGFIVCHCVYMMMITHPQTMTESEAMAILIAALCHDVDHRGFNNTYMQIFKMPLAGLYSTSVMEQHHYKQTVLIMQTEGHDIFSFLSTKDYKNMLDMIGEYILATDLAAHFQNQRVLQRLLEDQKLNMQIPEHRTRVKHLMMAAADLCSTAKPWLAHRHTVLCIYEEFYKQGDEEKSHGITPIPIMDRDRKCQAPQQQIDFIKLVSLPLFSDLSRVLVNTKPMLRFAERNAQRWILIQEAQDFTGRKSLIDDPTDPFPDENPTEFPSENHPNVMNSMVDDNLDENEDVL